jgi:hypothetical protein
MQSSFLPLFKVQQKHNACRHIVIRRNIVILTGIPEAAMRGDLKSLVVVLSFGV